MYWQCLSCTGHDVERFLQSQVTIDLKLLSEQQLAAGLLCNHRGQVVANLIMYKNNGWFLFVDNSLVDLVVAHTSVYASLSRVTINLCNDYFLHCQFGDHDVFSYDNQCKNKLIIPGSPSRVCEVVSNKVNELSDEWFISGYKVGLIDISQSLSGKFMASLLCYNRFNLISLSKGCYIGQEVLAKAIKREKGEREIVFTSDTDHYHALSKVLDTMVVNDSHVTLLSNVQYNNLCYKLLLMRKK